MLGWLERPEVIGVFAAPPCGTASAARQIQLEPYQHGPPPLRSVDMPDGLHGLTGDALIRVSFANMLYSFEAEVMDRCSELGKPCVIENPRNSLFWLTTPMVEREHTHLDCIQDHQACAYGSKRDKWTRLLANFAEIYEICLTCPKNHVHEPWGRVQLGAKRVFATSLEVHYPTGLCDAIAKAFCTHWASRGLQLSPSLSVNAFAQASSGRQPCGNKLPPLIPDFKCNFLSLWDDTSCLWPASRPPNDTCKLLHTFSLGRTGVKQCLENLTSACKLAHVKVELDEQMFGVLFEAGVCTAKIFGIFWTCDEFIQQAIEVGHPYDVDRILPPGLEAVMDYHLNCSALEVAKSRLKFVLKWSKRAKELKEAEATFRETMDPIVENAVKGKRILLFKEMLIDTGFPDLGVVEEVSAGVSLTGTIPRTNMLPSKFVPPSRSEAELQRKAALIRESSLAASTSSGDAEVDATVWSKTLEEVKCGWLEGPLPLNCVAWESEAY